MLLPLLPLENVHMCLALSVHHHYLSFCYYNLTEYSFDRIMKHSSNIFMSMCVVCICCVCTYMRIIFIHTLQVANTKCQFVLSEYKRKKSLLWSDNLLVAMMPHYQLKVTRYNNRITHIIVKATY